ncbi:MAG TPA: hybrid sensor histidine kinase/response regulator [Desulfobacteraceae bacterium]|nr:hybrid sensor histidine kinase/response regulator [Desulfobacteraceae bacterium]
MNLNSHLLGDLLVSMGSITKDQLEEALAFQQGFIEDTLPETELDRTELISRGRRPSCPVPKLGKILVEKGYLTEGELAPALEVQHKRATELSRLDTHKLATALEVGFVINSTVNLVDVLSLIMKYANIVTDSVASTLMLLDEKTGELVFSVPTGPKSDQLEDIRIPPGKGVAGWVAQNEQYLMVKDTTKDKRFYNAVDDMTGIETKSLLCVPMKSKRKLIGVLEVINKKDGLSFTEEDALLLSIFSHHAAIAIENALLFNSMQARLEKEKLIEQKVSDSERLRSIGTLAGGIAHDFNNILGAIMGYTELAQMEMETDSRPYSNLSKVIGASGRARDLISQILTFSRQSEKIAKPIQVNLIVKEALKLLRASLPKTIRMIEDVDCRSVVMGDSTQIHQVVMNLCTNAAHAMEKDGGPLTVSLKEVQVKTDEEDLSLLVPGLDPGLYLCLKVEDEGKGMPPYVMERIFDPFFTTKEQGRGTGMGLAVVHGIAKDHGGDIQVESEPGKGSIFRIYFPVIERDPEPPAKVEAEIVPRGTEHVMIVDDEIMLVDVAKSRLNSLGYRVTIETDAIQALERFNQSPKSYDLVMTDMSMPVMSGDRLAREILDIRPDIPVILTTGFSADMTAESALEKGFVAFLTKPMGYGDLARTVRNALDGKPQHSGS